MTSITTLLLALAPYIAPPLIGLVVYFVRRQIDLLPANQRAQAQDAAQVAVAATAQVAGDMNGPGKKQIAQELVNDQLSHLGMKVPPEVVNAMLESAVLALNMAKDASAQTVVPDPVVPQK